MRMLGMIQHDGIQLSPIGEIVAAQLGAVVASHAGMCLDTWTIMPDHVHVIVRVEGTASHRASVETLVAALKASVTHSARRTGLLGSRQPMWQRGFYDRVIRNQQELLQLREYIANNPKRWLMDGR
jgi:putative transposase